MTNVSFTNLYQRPQKDQLDLASLFVTRPHVMSSLPVPGAGLAAVTEVNSKRWAPSQKLRARWAWHRRINRRLEVDKDVKNQLCLIQ